MKMYGYKTHIYSLDIDLSLVRELAKEDENISFIAGDANEIQNAFPEHLLKVNNRKIYLYIYIFLHRFLLALYYYFTFARFQTVDLFNGLTKPKLALVQIDYVYLVARFRER